jgi:hypothetical protein
MRRCIGDYPGKNKPGRRKLTQLKRTRISHSKIINTAFQQLLRSPYSVAV